MAMAGMGGPVGAINAGTPTSANVANANTDPSEYLKRLNTYIYDYFMRNHHYECARAMLNESLPLGVQVKQSPNQRQPNGGAVDDMDTGSKDNMPDRPKDLPLPELPATGGHFLEDWWFQFWDIFHSRRNQAGKPSTLTYISTQRQAQKARSGLMGTIDPSMQRNFVMNGGMPVDLKKAAVHNSGNMNPNMQAQMARMRAQQVNQAMMQGNQMERQGSQMDARSGSPGSGDAPSPKRPRIDGNMQHMSQRPGQPGQMPANQVGLTSNHPPLDPTAEARTRDLLLSKGIDPDAMVPQTFYALAMQPTNQQQKSLEVYNHSMQQQMKLALNNAQASSNMTKGMPPNSAAVAAALSQSAAQGSPMGPAAMDGVMPEFAANGAMRGAMMPNPGVAGQPGAANGSHALQDYQMQLMLLEQQNKKRLLMARQEQDGMAAHTGVPVANGQFPPNMSPSGSRAGGPSPNPNDMQRGTPKMSNGLSPNGNMPGRGSPAPATFDPNNIPPQMRSQMMAMAAQNGQIGPRSAPQMPPGQLEMFTRQMQGQMMPNGTFPGAPQMPPNMMPSQQPMPGVQPGQVAPNMTPRQGPNTMPPPPAPQQNSGGAQPSSPAPAAAPPTPSQTAKPKPGSKKDTKAKAASKKGAGTTAATPASEAEQPPTPTPQTPITPMHSKTYTQGQNAGMPNGAGPHPPNGPQANGQPQVQPAQARPPQQAGMQQQQNPQDLGAGAFASMDGSDQYGNMLEFGSLENPDVLDNFDFDAFLNTTDGDGGLTGFDHTFPSFDGVGGVEAGGDSMGQ